LNIKNILNKTPFLIACKNGHLEIVKLLIATPGFTSLNTPNKYKDTPFLWACKNGHLEIVKLLILTPGFNSLNTICDYEKTPFSNACENGHLEIVKVLIATRGFNSLNIWNIWDNKGCTPLSHACINGHLEIVKFLINTPKYNKYNLLNIRDNYLRTPFYHACEQGHVKIVKLFINTPRFNSLNTPDADGETPFYNACANNKLNIIPLLLVQDKLIRPKDITQFSKAVKNIINKVDNNKIFYIKQCKTPLLIDIYRLTVFLSDDYLQVKNTYSKLNETIKKLPIINIYHRQVCFLLNNCLQNPSQRFFKIIKGLPSELQIKIIFATVNWRKTYILSKDFNDGLKDFVKKIENL
jgi:ankyrin repeat protein